jgi:hypothetical protein
VAELDADWGTLEMVANVVGWAKDARELITDEVGNALGDVDSIRDTEEPRVDGTASVVDNAGVAELWLLVDVEKDADVDSGGTPTLETTAWTWELDDTMVEMSSKFWEVDAEVEISTDSEMAPVEGPNIDVGTILLAAAVWLILLSNRPLVDVIWTDPSAGALVLNAGAESEIDPGAMDDAIELVSAMGDDSTWRTLDDGKIEGELVSEAVWTSSEVGIAKDTLDMICEIVFGSSTVDGETSETLVVNASRDVCIGKI